MDLLEYKGYEGTAEVDLDRGVCCGHILFINDLVTYESTGPKTIKAEFRQAVDDYLATCLQVGKEPQKPFKGLFNVRVPPPVHKAAAIRSVRDGVSLNEVVVQALTAYLRPRSDVYHHLTVTFDSTLGPAQTYRTVASATTQWAGAAKNVH